MIGSGDLYWGMTEVESKKLLSLPFEGTTESNYYDQNEMEEFLSVRGLLVLGLSTTCLRFSHWVSCWRRSSIGRLLVTMNPVLENVTEQISIFLPTSFLNCFVSQSPSDYNDRYLFASAVRMGLFPLTEEVMRQTTPWL